MEITSQNIINNLSISRNFASDFIGYLESTFKLFPAETSNLFFDKKNNFSIVHITEKTDEDESYCEFFVNNISRIIIFNNEIKLKINNFLTVNYIYEDCLFLFCREFGKLSILLKILNSKNEIKNLDPRELHDKSTEFALTCKKSLNYDYLKSLDFKDLIHGNAYVCEKILKKYLKPSWTLLNDK